jgi:Domain of unknown function (DUF4381)
MDDPADLSRLADIVLPPPIPWWPPAPGWWILGAGCLAALAIVVVAAIGHYRRNAYRRVALAELSSIKQNDPGAAAAISTVLKRVALVAYPRSDVAGLTGARWAAFLDRTGGASDFTAGPAAGLAGAVQGGGLANGDAIVAAARRWVQRHKASA